ncbi:MAG: L,D-transpeptidase, partial [Variibacter sp.]|nr:L,D-transpeptidase [Variibacter sp.]
MRTASRIAAVLLCAALASLVTAAARAALLIEIDKERQRLSVSVDGVQRYDWPVSTGRAGHETPDGEFKPFRLEEDHYSKEWDDAPMPHSIFFTRQGHAIHGSDAVRKLGSPASAGCVRLSRANASVLFALVKEHGLANV